MDAWSVYAQYLAGVCDSVVLFTFAHHGCHLHHPSWVVLSTLSQALEVLLGCPHDHCIAGAIGKSWTECFHRGRMSLARTANFRRIVDLNFIEASGPCVETPIPSTLWVASAEIPY